MAASSSCSTEQGLQAARCRGSAWRARARACVHACAVVIWQALLFCCFCGRTVCTICPPAAVLGAGLLLTRRACMHTCMCNIFVIFKQASMDALPPLPTCHEHVQPPAFARRAAMTGAEPTAQRHRHKLRTQQHQHNSTSTTAPTRAAHQDGLLAVSSTVSTSVRPLRLRGAGYASRRPPYSA